MRWGMQGSYAVQPNHAMRLVMAVRIQQMASKPLLKRYDDYVELKKEHDKNGTGGVVKYVFTRIVTQDGDKMTYDTAKSILPDWRRAVESDLAVLYKGREATLSDGSDAIKGRPDFDGEFLLGTEMAEAKLVEYGTDAVEQTLRNKLRAKYFAKRDKRIKETAKTAPTAIPEV